MDIDMIVAGSEETRLGLGFGGNAANQLTLSNRLRPPSTVPSGPVRKTGLGNSFESYRIAVEEVILFMYRRYDRPFSLQEMADVAGFSPHHFNRLFRKITGVTPARFLSALRLRAAVHLLLTTELHVTDICYAVGYNSLGSFTTRFTQSVGIAPTRLRELAQDAMPTLAHLTAHGDWLGRARMSASGIRGSVDGAKATDRWIFVGLFQTSIPQGCPIGCTLLPTPGKYGIGPVPDGRYHAFAAGFSRSPDPMSFLLPDFRDLQVGTSQNLVFVHNGRAQVHVDITLRPMQLINPPILAAMPLLMVEKVRNLEEAAAR